MSLTTAKRSFNLTNQFGLCKLNQTSKLNKFANFKVNHANASFIRNDVLFKNNNYRYLSWWAKDDPEKKGKENEKKENEKDDTSNVDNINIKTEINGNSSENKFTKQSHSDNKGENILTSSKNAPVLQLRGAPRPPNILALPLDRRPIFPGLLHPIQITDRVVYEALLHAKASGNPYLGLFLRKTDLKARDFLEVAPSDRILAINEVYPVGTFVQIMQMDPLQPMIEDSNGYVDDETGLSIVEMSNNESSSSRHQNKIGKFLGNNDKSNPKEQRMLMNAKEESWTMLVKAHRRVQIEEMLSTGPPPLMQVNHITEFPVSNYDTNTIRACTNEVLVTLRDVIRHNPLLREHMQFLSARFDMSDPHHVCNFAASLTSADGTDLQEILEAFNLEARLKKVLTLLKKEVHLNSLQEEISKSVEETISANQRKYFLNEQLKQIKKELGLEHDDKDALLEKFQTRLKEIKDGPNEKFEGAEELPNDKNIDQNDGNQKKKSKQFTYLDTMPEEVEKVITEEMKKLSTLEKTSPEFNVTRSYLEWLLCLPWGKCNLENLDVKKAGDILEADHFGLSDIKERILEFIAVGNLRGTVQGKIILLVGPPGVGKTSIGKSIAHSLDREFYRFSVGGLSDVSEIKGHRRTYIGSMPGKLVQCLKTTGVSNPVVLIDEIDKLGSGYRGDPASALLELLDPAQNQAFLDHYLDVPIDLSKVLFVCTANSTDTIPRPLLDRMEVLRLSGYDLPEKVQIAKRYLEPRARDESGLNQIGKETEGKDQSNNDKNETNDENSDDFVSTDLSDEPNNSTTNADTGVKDDKLVVPKSLHIDDSALDSLVRWYCREAGVRKLEQHIERIYRKSSLKLLQSSPEERKEKDWTISESNLEDYVGKPRFQSDKLFDSIPPPGVVMGLAWSTVGGSALYIETTCIANSFSFSNNSQANEKDKKESKENQKGKGGGGGFAVHTTGQLGDVMKESNSLALTNAKHKLQQLEPGNSFFEDNQIHMHVPEGATPKDGPSAGVTMTTALLGLALNKPVKADLAMTGEISLTGMVLPVGGIKEKVIAARRSGVTTVILPDGCRKDADELPDYLKDNLTIHFVKTYDQVYDIAFEINK